MTRARSFSILGVLALAACAEPPVTPIPQLTGGRGISYLTSEARTYVLVGKGAGLPSNLAASVASAGGTLTASMDGISVAVATSDAANFLARAEKATGMDVAEDVMVQFQDPNQPVEQVTVDEAAVNEQSHIGANETFRPEQWGPDAISAPAAWHAGQTGKGARVAILDGAIYNLHIDIRDRLDVARSASFVPGFAYNQDVGTFWHGTHVAGIVAAPANNIGTVGIAPDATLIGVKVLHGGGGQFSWVIQGIEYASRSIADGGAGADIINMSLGAGIIKGGGAGPGLSHLLNAVTKAVNQAHQRGVTVVSAAGNSAVDIGGRVVFIPAMSGSSLAVSATGPVGFALGATNFDRPASYTNFGKIDFAAPGGDFVLPGDAICSMPRLPSGVVTFPCWVFDMVAAPCRGGPTSISTYCWAAGTSMASPHVAGVAALIVSKFGHPGPAQVEAKLRQSADDLGKPGKDDFYGHGRVNAFRAVQ